MNAVTMQYRGVVSEVEKDVTQSAVSKKEVQNANKTWIIWEEC